MNPSPEISIVHTDQEEQHHLQQVAGHVTEATGHVHTSFDIQPPRENLLLDTQTAEYVNNYGQTPSGDGQTLSEDNDSLADSLPFSGSAVGASPSLTFLQKKMGWLGKKHGGEVRLK